MSQHVPRFTTQITQFWRHWTKFVFICDHFARMWLFYMFLGWYQNARKHIHLSCKWTNVFVLILNLCQISFVISFACACSRLFWQIKNMCHGQDVVGYSYGHLILGIPAPSPWRFPERYPQLIAIFIGLNMYKPSSYWGIPMEAPLGLYNPTFDIGTLKKKKHGANGSRGESVSLCPRLSCRRYPNSFRSSRLRLSHWPCSLQK